MTKNTHIFAANALNILILNPTNIKEYALIISASTIGSIISDIDVSTSTSHKDITIISLISSFIIIATLLLDNYLNYGLINIIKENTNIYKTLLAFSLFILTCAHGLHSKHRSFTHSILGLFIFTGLIYFIFKDITIPFFLAFLSHILLDLLNKKNIQILYPLKFKICFKLCDSNGFINSLICIISIIILIIR